MGLWSYFKTMFIMQLLMGYVFVTSGLCVSFLCLLSYIFVWPFNKCLYRKLVCNLAYSFWCRKYSITNFVAYLQIYKLKQYYSFTISGLLYFLFLILTAYYFYSNLKTFFFILFYPRCDTITVGALSVALTQNVNFSV